MTTSRSPWFVQALLAPILLVVLACLAFGAVARGVDSGLVLVVHTVVLAVLLVVLERRYPFRSEWSGRDPKLVSDLVHAGVGTGIGGALGFALAKGLAHLVHSTLISRGVRLPWNTAWAPALQFALAFLVIDFGRYWQHRWLHTSRFGWRLHLLHHDIEKLNTTKTARAHILERIVQQVCLFTPILSLGAPESLLFFYSFAGTSLGLFAHANLDTRWGLFDYVLMTPRAHRLHHAKDAHAGNSNFGDLFVVWDHVFRTYTRPTRTNEGLPIGVESHE